MEEANQADYENSNEFEYDEINGSFNKKSCMHILNKKKLSPYDMDMLLGGIE